MLKGSSVNFWLLSKSKNYKEFLIDNFDYLYFDGGFDGSCSIEKAQEISKFAIKNNKRLRGNHLISHVSFRKYSENEFVNIIKNKINSFSEIREWECVHEAIADNGYFRNKFNQEKIEKYFYRAKENNSSNVYFYADYYRDERKWKATHRMLEVALNKNVPIDGLSIQLMSNLFIPIEGNPLTLNLEIAELWIKKIKADFPQLKIVAPETVVWQPVPFFSKKELSNSIPKYIKYDKRKEWVRKYAIGLMLQPYNIEKLQRQGYKLIVEMCQRCGVEMFGFWSTVDDQWNWIGNRCKAGLITKDFQPKPASQVLEFF